MIYIDATLSNDKICDKLFIEIYMGGTIMAQDIENKIEEEKETEVATEEVEEYDIYAEGEDGIDEEDLAEAGYKIHKFSLFDSPVEIATIAFMTLYVVFALCSFAIDNPYGAGLMKIFTFLFELVTKLIPGFILIIACEIHEKVELIEYNLSLNSEYMARYQMDLMDKLNKKDK